MANAIPTVTLSPSSPVYITDWGILNLTCSVDQDVGLGSVLFRRFGHLVIQINTSMSACMYHKADSADTYRYNVTCHQNRTFTMLQQGFNNSDRDTTWSCEMVSAHNGPCNESGNLCISQNVTVLMVFGQLFFTTGSMLYTAQRYDNGMTLACEAYNGFGSTQRSDNLKLIIYHPPTICSLQSVYRVIEKQTLNLTCQANSNPQPSHISWFPSGEVYSTSILYFNSVSRNNSGNYTCTALNNMTSTDGVQRTGSDTKWIEVDVLYPPFIFSPTSPYKVIEYETLDVTCQVIGNPTPDKIFWSSSGEAYFSRLYFKSVTRNNSGNYTCTARNIMTPGVGAPQIGSDTRQIEYTVTDPATVFVQTEVYKVIENHTLDVPCQIFSNPPPDQIFWFPSGEASDPSRLYFKSVSRNNSGNYSCTARNTMTPSVGGQQKSSDTREIAVDILYPSAITEFTAKDNELFENSSLQLQCRVDSNPYSVISLYHGDNLKFRVQDTYELKYTSTVGCLDAGIYTCRANNSLMNGDTVSADAHIKVLCKPGIPTEFEINGRAHDSVTLEWTPGFPGSNPQYFFIEYRRLPDVKWLTASPASEDTNLKKQYYTVYGLQQETSYEFQMFAINKVGPSAYTNVINGTTSGIIGEYKTNSTPIVPLVGGVLGAIAVAVIVIVASNFGKRRGCCKKNSTKLEDNLGNDVLSSASRTDQEYLNMHQIDHKQSNINKTADQELTGTTLVIAMTFCISMLTLT
ncbi:hypothetical protein CHS0354_013671 [Potamilus streckersoni]|uniref:Uncharacterized protein n=1 Tax=Potamilus streckersoni TaxID=2493646 RepID=A0AAE0SEZ2_9BIVA|nr:hypothetical protein CHS0354_013671 [Potamilus streckersoni]